MQDIFEIASQLSTPLALGGFFAAILFSIFRQIIKKDIFPSLTRSDGAELIKIIVDKITVLALVSMVLGFSGFVYVATIEAKITPPSQIEKSNEIITSFPTTEKNDISLPNISKKELNIVVVMSESQPYEQLIIHSFLERLRSKVKVQSPIIQRQLKHFISPANKEGEKKWKEFVNNIYTIYAGQHVDYVVTVGTFASIAVTKFNLVKNLDAKGLVFLGVTDPVRAKLVKSIDGRHEEVEIAGTRYGSGGIDYGKTLGSLFRSDQKLVFVYDKRTPQDTYIASDITYLKDVNGDSRFELRELERTVESGDLGNPNSPNDAHEIYFAWYGLDDILSDTGGIEILKEKRVIPSTYSPEILQAAGIVVSVDDQKVGELGADILLKNYLDSNQKLGNESIAMPPFKVWTDCETIRRKGIKIMPGYC